MARGERIAMVTVALLLFGLSALVNGADAAENLFPVFPTYPVDGNMEDEARYGVISVNYFLFLFFEILFQVNFYDDDKKTPNYILKITLRQFTMYRNSW